MNAMALYFRMIAISLKSQLQYRASFVLMSIGNALGAFIEYLGLWAFFDRFGALGSWTLAEAGLFYGMGNIAFALAEAFMREFNIFQNHVRTGDFDRLLLRPRSTVLQMLGAECQLMRLGRLLQGVAVLAVSIRMLGVSFTWDQWVLMALAIIGGMLLFSSIIILQATSCFFTVESLEVWNSITYGGVYAIQYPLEIYQRVIRWVFTYLVPLAAINYWPCAYLLGRAYASPALSWLSPGIGLLAFCLSLVVWNLGARRYRSTGS